MTIVAVGTDVVEMPLAHRIAHAESYPFARPACSYLFENGAMHPLPKDAARGRIPVVASGSNASPKRLAAKFGADHRIPVMRAELRHFAVVFAGHFTAYGAIPATLCPHADASTEVWITWLTPDQQAIMHRSEGVIGCREAKQRYDYVELEGLDLRPEFGVSIEAAGAYLSRRMFAPEGTPVRFAEVPARGCRLEAASERATLRRAAGLLDGDAGFAGFMSEVLDGAGRRQALFERLTPHVIDRDDTVLGKTSGLDSQRL